MKRIAFFLTFLVITTFPAFLHAEEAGLTESAIRALFVENETAHHKPFPEYLALIKKTTHERYQGKILMRISIDDNTPVELEVQMDKKMIIDQARESHENLAQATVKGTIESITISPDKKSATVKSRMVILNQKIPLGADALQITRADSEVTGIDDIVYTPVIGLQFIKSNYISTTTVKKEQEL